MNLASWLAGLAVAGIVVLIIKPMIGNKRSGSCSCGCSSCGGACPHGLSMRRKEEKKNETE